MAPGENEFDSSILDRCYFMRQQWEWMIDKPGLVLCADLGNHTAPASIHWRSWPAYPRSVNLLHTFGPQSRFPWKSDKIIDLRKEKLETIRGRPKHLTDIPLDVLSSQEPLSITHTRSSSAVAIADTPLPTNSWAPRNPQIASTSAGAQVNVFVSYYRNVNLSAQWTLACINILHHFCLQTTSALWTSIAASQNGHKKWLGPLLLHWNLGPLSHLEHQKMKDAWNWSSQIMLPCCSTENLYLEHFTRWWSTYSSMCKVTHSGWAEMDQQVWWKSNWKNSFTCGEVSS